MKNKWLDQKPFRVTAEQAMDKWGTSGRELHCKLCGNVFQEGETARWVYVNGTPGAGCGNFFVCQGCDGPNVLENAIKDFKATRKAAKRWGFIE